MKYTIAAYTLLLSLVAEIAVAQDVRESIDALLSRVTVLTTENEDLQSFYFHADVPAPYGFPASFDVGWTRDDGFGFVMFDGERNPVMFIAQRRILIYDPASEAIWFDEGAVPTVQMFSKDGKWQYNCGYTSEKNLSFNADFRSSIEDNFSHSQIEQLGSNRIRAMTISRSGKTETVANFDVSAEYPLLDFTLRDSQTKEELVGVRDIEVNQGMPARLKQFPDLDQLRDSFTLIDIKDLDGPESVLLLLRAVAAPAAIKTPALREFPFWKNVDWTRAATFHQQSSSKLVELLRVPSSSNSE
jgi:hypothetical protein